MRCTISALERQISNEDSMSKIEKPRFMFVVMVSLLVLCACDGKEGDKGNATASANTTTGEGASKAPDGEKAKDSFLLEPPAKALPADATPGGHLRVGLSRADMQYSNLIRHPDRVPLINGFIQEPLARHHPDDPTRFVKGLADSVEISDGGRTFTIKLREGVRWPTPPHPQVEEEKFGFLKEPHEVNVEDIMFTIGLYFGPQQQAGATGFEGMESIKPIDEHTVKITWKFPSHEALVLLMSLRLQPKWLFSRDLGGKVMPDQMLVPLYDKHWAHAYPIGLGPYKVRTSQAAVGIWLDRNPDYFGPPPLLDSIELRDIDDEQQRIDLITAGDLDLTILPPTQTSKVDGVPRVAHEKLGLFTYYFIGYNNQRAPYNDARVRRALSHSVDRERILKEAFDGAATLVDGPLLPDHPALAKDGKTIVFDLDRAKALLDEAGIKDSDGDGVRDFEVGEGDKRERRPFTLSLLSYNRTDWSKAITIWRKDLAKIGVGIEVKESGSPTRSREVFQREFDALVGGWGNGYSNRLHEVWHSSKDDPRELNYVQFRNERADELLQILQTSHDPVSRADSFREFDALVREEQPFTFLFVPHRILAWNQRISNVNIEKFAPQLDPRDWYIAPEDRLPSEKKNGEEAEAPSP